MCKKINFNPLSRHNLLHILALMSIGVMSYIFADIIHEVVGHGVTCLLTGSSATLFSAAYFRAANNSMVTVAVVPLVNLAAGLIIYMYIRNGQNFKGYIQLLLVHTMAFNLCWFSWQYLYAGVTNTGDFTFNVAGTTESITWRILLVIAGLLFYRMSVYLLVKTVYNMFEHADGGISGKQLSQLFFIPYMAAGFFALLGASLFYPFTFAVLTQAFVFPMFFPVLLIQRYLNNKNKLSENKNKLFGYNHSIPIVVSGLVLFIVFCCTMGRGMRS